MTCHEAEQELDLLAAGECDAPTGRIVEDHLRGCPACAARFEESQRLLGLLDLHLSDAGPARLRRRIEQEQRRGRNLLFMPAMRRALALAAMVLLTVGLTWLPPRWRNEGQPELQLAMHEIREDAAKKSMQEARGPLHELKSNEVAKVPGPPSRDKLPAPAAVALEMVLKNTGTEQVQVRVVELSLEVNGDGVTRLPAPAAEPPRILDAKPFVLKAGKVHVFRVDRLIAGAPGRLQFIYLTRSGDYTITASLHLTVGRTAVTVRSEPVRITVPGDAFP